MIYAKVIADSVSPTGSRLTTVEAQFHRYILPEVNTHRAFSREIYANGSVKAAQWARGQKPGLYTMKDVLGLSG